MDTFHSTDAGVAYLVTCGEGKIYHAETFMTGCLILHRRGKTGK